MIPFATDSYTWQPANTDIVLGIALDEEMLIKNRKGVAFYNLPASFDIETTSFYVDEHGNTLDYKQKARVKEFDDKFNPTKVAIMYVWQLGINGQVIVGRTWEEFFSCLKTISETLELSINKRLVIYVHNLGYEFQFMRHRFKWYKVFSTEERKPVYAITEDGFEFRCSYLLSGYSLANLGKQLVKYPVRKLVGDLDYDLMRHHATPLSKKEIGYCVNDVRVVMSYIQEEIERNGNITKIPLTKTGNVRNYCRKRTLRHDNNNTNRDYVRLIHDLRINDIEEFNMMQRAFAGGFTHANVRYMGEECFDVASYDFTSSYPTVMLAEKFPMSRGRKVYPPDMKTFRRLLDEYCCIFDCKFIKISPKVVWENPISSSKCWEKSHYAVNNGRIVIAEKIGITITDVDFKVIEAFYRWEDFELGEMYIYKRDYLPQELLECILDLYEAKTVLKGVEGKEIEYLQSKAMLNSIYGMSVTNILRDEFLYEEDDWHTVKPQGEERQEKLFKNNRSRQRFLFYPWGIYVTAYARRNLFSGILALGQDYIYSDTDSIKCFNHEEHQNYFEWYNANIMAKLHKVADHYGFDFARFSPKTIEGVEKPIGVWDYEGSYKRFKTLGAKRYMVEADKALRVGDTYYPVSLTVSGVNKFTSIPYLLEKYETVDGVFKAFEEYLEVPAGHAGKLLHMYIDEPREGILVDYTGKAAHYEELSAVHLEPSGYNLSLADAYLAYVYKMKTRLL